MPHFTVLLPYIFFKIRLKMTPTPARARHRVMIDESGLECANRVWFEKSAKERKECVVVLREEVHRMVELREDLR